MDQGLVRKIAEFAYNSDNEQVSNAAAIVLQQPSLYQGFKVKKQMSKQDLIHWLDEKMDELETEILFEDDDFEGFSIENQGYNKGRIDGQKELIATFRRMLVGE